MCVSVYHREFCGFTGSSFSFFVYVYICLCMSVCFEFFPLSENTFGIRSS